MAPAGAVVGDCTPQPAWGSDLTAAEQQVIALVNQHRTGMGLNALVPASSLAASAEWKSMNMAGYQYLAHDDPAPVARSIADRFAACGYPTNAGWGENIAYGYVDPQSVMNAWLSDPGHKANIESASWTTIGVGVAQASNGLIFWTQDFGTTGASIPSPPPPPTSDTTPPSVPTGLAASTVGQTSVSFGWTPSTDAGGVAGYDVYVNGGLLGATGLTTGTIGGLTCGTTYTLGVDAYDASGNHSAIATQPVTTAACSGGGAAGGGGGGGGGGAGGGGGGGSNTQAPTAPGPAAPTGAAQASTLPSPPPPGDTQAPSVPGGLAGSTLSRTAVSLAWAPSSDDVGATGYDVLLDGNPVTTTGGGSWSFTGLTCGTAYTLGIDAFDAAGNHSAVATAGATTSACASRHDRRLPSAPTGVSASAASKTAIDVAWHAARDNVAVAGYAVYLKGTRLRSVGPRSTAARISGLVCGSRYPVGIVAYDGAGNRSPVVTVYASTRPCKAMAGK